MTARANKFAGKCESCGARVAAGAGTLTREGQRFVVRHIDDGCPAAAEPAEAPVEFDPTSEQADARSLFLTGESMVIEAGAGTGKTSTLKLLAEAVPEKRVQYLAFNRAIVDEAAAKFPANVAANTAHSLAFRAVGRRYQHRLDAKRQTSDHIARILGIDPIKVTVENVGHRTLAAGFLAGRVMAAVERFCQTADEQPERRHFPYIEGIDLPDANGRRTFANNDEVAAELLPFARAAWRDLSDLEGELRFGHHVYLKLWQLGQPRIDADVILFDEAQDANPVMAAIVAAQSHAQVVYVGDSQQAIYEFTGAVNTLASLDTSHRVFLTQSFRFGEAIAAIANDVLELLDAELRLEGTPSIPSTLGIGERDDAILCRTNATAMETVLELLEQGRRPHLVGGGTEVLSFAKGVRELQTTGSTSHPELACFDSWKAVVAYVENDEQGGDLRLLVALIEKFGVEAILRALDNMVSEAGADVIVSTAHKAKGREWDSVRLAADFPVEPDRLNDGELRLIYVAVTRARLRLDATAVLVIFGEDDLPEPPAPAPAAPAAELVDDAYLAWLDR